MVCGKIATVESPWRSFFVRTRDDTGSFSVDFNPYIIREYDIRGEVESDLTRPVVEALGRAFGTYLKRSGGHVALIGRDCRLSSADLSEALILGIRETGISVVDAGLITTPCLYFGLHTLEVDGGVMITGSHNPPEYNGFKVAIGHSTLYGEEIKRIASLLESDDFESGSGEYKTIDLLSKYTTHLAQAVSVQRDLKVVIDSGNGTAGLIAPDIFRDAGCEVIELFSEPDGTFPNHHPDPTLAENLEDLIRRVSEEGAELGIAFDGDADRIGVVDENGKIIWGDHLMILFSREILAEGPASVVFEVKCSQALSEEIKKLGGNPVMGSTGHSLIKKKMKEVGAVLAGEMSGHIFFADKYFGFDDAIYAAIRLVGICSRTELPLSQLLSDVPRYYSTPEIRIDCPDHRKFDVVREVKEHYQKDHEVIDVDGARILFPGGWGLVRASNTQPVLVLRFEADSEERLNEIKVAVLAVLKDIGGITVSE
jgi:phosphomannomutase/phosphoglucomutase